MSKTVKSILKRKSPSPKSPHTPRITKKKHVNIDTHYNVEKSIEKLFDKDNLSELWTTPNEKRKAELERTMEEIRELGEHNYSSNKRNRIMQRKQHAKDILQSVNKEFRANNSKSNSKLDTDEPVLPRLNVTRKRMNNWGGKSKKMRKSKISKKN